MSEFHYVRTLGDDGGVDAVEGPAVGLDLEAMLRDGLPPFKVALEIVAALCEILDIADQDGEEHGDLSPKWVFIDDLGAVSVEGFGTRRDQTQAPEGRPDGATTDLYGLGYLCFRLFSARDLPDRSSDPDEHDDVVIDAIIGINFEDLPEEIIGDIQWYMAKLMSADPEDRPPAVDVWRTFIAFAGAVDGPALDEWAAEAVHGGGERRDQQKALEAPKPPPEADAEDEDLGGPVRMRGPLSKGAISFDAGGPKSGQATAFWSRDQMKAALEAEEEEEEYRPAPGGGSATAFWSREQMQAMSEGRDDAPRPKRKPGGRAATSFINTSDLQQAKAAETAQPPPPKPVSAAPTPAAVARQVATPTAQQPVASQPVASQPVAMQPMAGPGSIEPEQAEGGGAMKWLVLGVAVVAILGCIGVLTAGGTYALFASGGSETGAALDVVEPEPRPEPEPEPEPEAEAEAEADPEPEPEPSKAPSRPASSGTASASTAGSGGGSGSTAGTSRPTGSTGTATSGRSRPGGDGGTTRRSRPEPTPAPAATGGPATIELQAPGRGRLRCNDGQTPEFSNRITLNVESYALPITCIVLIDGKQGVFQSSTSASITCQIVGNDIICG